MISSASLLGNGAGGMDNVLTLGLGVTPARKLAGLRPDTDKRLEEWHIEVAACGTLGGKDRNSNGKLLTCDEDKPNGECRCR